ncbi:MAG TPA: hypothetical protein VED59_02645, partial [Acidimicrobiales bacterium]|nr:hypothetical protein [Acidimicrobiales bacterium]
MIAMPTPGTGRLNNETLRLAWYQFRSTWRRRWPGYLSLALLIGLVGGLAMGSVAAARRTDSSFHVFLDSTNYSELSGVTGVLNPQAGLAGYDPAIVSKIVHLPLVKKIESQAGVNIMPLLPDGAPRDVPGYFSPGPGNGYGSVDGAFFDIDRVTVVKGRMADPRHADEIMLSAGAAAALHVGVGSLIWMGIYTNSQTQLPAFGTPKVKPYKVVDMRVVGIDVANSQVIEDDVDKGNSADTDLLTPAFTRPLLRCCVNYTGSAVQVDGG